MKPLIGVSASFTAPEQLGPDQVRVNGTYLDSVAAAGGAAVVLAPSRGAPPAAWAADLLDRVDGLLLTGGRDYDPALYGAARHERTRPMHPLRSDFELALLSEADRRTMPVLGICLGIQTVALARGGRLHQNVADVDAVRFDHAGPGTADPPMHPVRVLAGSRLHGIVGATTLAVNSRHHQAVADPGEHLTVTAVSADGLIEAVEDDRPDRWLLAVQWHPEDLAERPEHGALFAALVAACGRRGADCPKDLHP